MTVTAELTWREWGSHTHPSGEGKLLQPLWTFYRSFLTKGQHVTQLHRSWCVSIQCNLSQFPTWIFAHSQLLLYYSQQPRCGISLQVHQHTNGQGKCGAHT